nr:hypothetical protein [Tanacetum cinerariifolium]
MSHSTISIPSDFAEESVRSLPSLLILSDTEAEVMAILAVLPDVALKAATTTVVTSPTAIPDLATESDKEDDFEPIEDAHEATEPLSVRIAPPPPVHITPALPISCYRETIARWSVAPLSTLYPSHTLEDSISLSGSPLAAPSVPRSRPSCSRSHPISSASSCISPVPFGPLPRRRHLVSSYSTPSASVRPSRKRCRSPTTLRPATSAPAILSSVLADRLPPCKRLKGSPALSYHNITIEVASEPVSPPVHHRLTVLERLDEQSEVTGEMYEHLLEILIRYGYSSIGMFDVFFRNQLLVFQQHHDESVYDSWTHFKDIIRKVPNHGLSIWTQIEIFLKHLDSLSYHIINLTAKGDLRKFSDIGVWYAIEDCVQYDKKCINPINVISDETIANLNAQIVRDDMVRVQELQALRVSYEPCRHLRNTHRCSGEVPSFDKPEPQPQPLPNCSPLDASLEIERGLKPPIKPQSLDSFRMKVLDNSTIYTPPSSLVASFHLRDLHCYYRPCIDDLKKHYGFKPGSCKTSCRSPLRKPHQIPLLRIEEIEEKLKTLRDRVVTLERENTSLRARVRATELNDDNTRVALQTTRVGLAEMRL